MGLSLVAFDTDHIKQYVFGTSKLKEIRGASSRLDYLNRIVMEACAAPDHHAQKIYAHGGSGLFLVDTLHVNTFKALVQQSYHDETGGGASITAVDLPVPEHIDVHKDDIKDLLDLLQWRLQEEKARTISILALPSHPFMRPCDACGIEYVDASEHNHENIHDFDIDDEVDPREEGERYCQSCYSKRSRDFEVKSFIRNFIDPKSAKKGGNLNDYLWKKIISRLSEMQYKIPSRTRRPEDFNVFRNFKGAKDYLALIYADANSMGRAIEHYTVLSRRQTFAHTIDNAVYEAVCTAIARHLKINDHLKPQEQRSEDLKHPVFPFDILLMGGDDICMVVPASVALDVALTLSETFHTETQKACKQGELLDAYTLSIGVVLAPVKYPFGLLQDMAESTLKFAKKAGADAQAKDKDADDTRINFMIVTGNTSRDFKSVHNTVYHKQDDDKYQEFFATLRPYTPNELDDLLKAIRNKDVTNLGRTKLHQIREAVLTMNLTTSVRDGLSVLQNWRERQRNHVVQNVYAFAGKHQMQYSNPDDPVSGFPRVIFPWFRDGTKTYNKHQYKIYRTSLLDFIELYDFISRDGGDNAEGI
jgi:hypothetical protein